MKSNKKIIAVILILIVSVSLYAGGNKENEADVTSTYQGTIFYRFLTAIAKQMDNVTSSLVLAIHPFPNIMYRFYDLDSEDSLNSVYTNEFDLERDLLISNEYYSRTDTEVSINYDDQFHVDTGPLALNEKGGSETQKSRWSMTSLLFAVFISAEIIFTAIWGYITGKDTSLLKDLVAKVGICVALFLLAAALPFLLEAVRYGFLVIVDTYKNPNSEYAKVNEHGNLKTALSYDDFNFFTMPGFFLRQMAFLLDNMAPGAIGASSVNLLTEDGTSQIKMDFLTKIVTTFIYFIFRLVMIAMVIKASLHIMKNVIEVYILLALVMILMPFSVFTPTKHIGEKSVMSLLANLVECFIIAIVLLTVVPACRNVYDAVFGSIVAEQRVKTNTISFSNVDLNVNKKHKDSLLVEGTGSDKKTYNYNDYNVDFMISSEAFCFVYSPILSDKAYRWIIWGGDYKGSTLEDYFKVSENLFDESYEIAWYDNDEFKKDTNLVMGESGKQTVTLCWYASILQIMVRNMFSASGPCRYALASTGQNTDTEKNDYIVAQKMLEEESIRTAFFEFIESNINSKYGPNKRNKDYTESFTYEKHIEAEDSLILRHLVVSFIGAYLPCFFVQQSTQIMNALMQGSTAQESLGNAMSQIGQNVNKIAGAMTSVVGNVAKMAAGVPSASQNKSMNNSLKSIESKMTPLGNMSSSGGSSGGTPGGNP